MTVQALRESNQESSKPKRGQLLVALPEPGLSMNQDAEWCVARVNGTWRQIRFHNYDELYSIPGLYEKVIYEILQCDSPRVVCRLLRTELARSSHPAASLRVLDLGAGNGIVGEELAEMGAGLIVGADIIEEAAAAAERDRPGIYDNYHVTDMAAIDAGQRREFSAYRFNALTCIAALGFGDIPVPAFVSAYNLICEGGWIAFNIKEDFLTSQDRSGFAGLISGMIDDGILELRQQQRYRHRLATDQRPLHYMALVGIKRRNVTEDPIH